MAPIPPRIAKNDDSLQYLKEEILRLMRTDDELYAAFKKDKRYNSVTYVRNDENWTDEEIQALIPTNISAFNNDAGYLTSVSWSDIQDMPSFDYLPLSGGSESAMTGTLFLKGDVYKSNGGGLNCKNSDIINLNALWFNDLAGDYTEGICFARTNDNFDGFYAQDGTFFFKINNGSTGARLSGGGGNLYLGNSDNAGWLMVQDICSQSGSSYWHIEHDGKAQFASVNSKASVKALSDERKKNVIGDVPLTVEQIAKMPAVLFEWIDPTIEKGVHVGTLAQRWQTVLPSAVTESEDGTLLFCYGETALASSIVLARRVLQLEQELKELKRVTNR